MSGAAIHEIERGVEIAAAAVLGAAVTYCLWMLLDLPLLPSPLGLAVAGLGGGIIGLCRELLDRIDSAPRGFAVAPFALAPIDPPAADELLLDDVLPQPGLDSRVVRLFDPAARPTPGELKARIDRHLAASPAPDASQALYDALAGLRSELR